MSALVTVECSAPEESYGPLEHSGGLVVHLAGPGKTGGTGPNICGYDRFLGGFSVGGGVTGPGVKHNVCQGCTALVKPGDTIAGTHRAYFTEVAA